MSQGGGAELGVPYSCLRKCWFCSPKAICFQTNALSLGPGCVSVPLTCALVLLLPRKMPAEDKGAAQDRKSPPAEVKTVPNEATQTNENESKA